MTLRSSSQRILYSLMVPLLKLIRSVFVYPASILVQFLLYIAQYVLYPWETSSPIKRTSTKHLTLFARPHPAAVSYDMSQPDSVTITVPPQSTWTTGPHWHESHTEYLKVLEGLARIRLGDKTKVYGPLDGVIEVPRFVIHEWQREAKGYARTDGEERTDLVVREWTAPADGQKEMFFRTLNSYLLESEPEKLHRSLPLPSFLLDWLEQRVILVQLLVVFRTMDNWPAYNGEAGSVGWRTWISRHMYLLLAAAVGKLLGLERTYEDYKGPGTGTALRSS